MTPNAIIFLSLVLIMNKHPKGIELFDTAFSMGGDLVDLNDNEYNEVINFLKQHQINA